jgi:hypothetical protein
LRPVVQVKYHAEGSLDVPIPDLLLEFIVGSEVTRRPHVEMVVGDIVLIKPLAGSHLTIPSASRDNQYPVRRRVIIIPVEQIDNVAIRKIAGDLIPLEGTSISHKGRGAIKITYAVDTTDMEDACPIFVRMVDYDELVGTQHGQEFPISLEKLALLRMQPYVQTGWTDGGRARMVICDSKGIVSTVYLMDRVTAVMIRQTVEFVREIREAVQVFKTTLTGTAAPKAVKRGAKRLRRS